MAFYLRENGSTTFYVEPRDVVDAIVTRNLVWGTERLIEGLGVDPVVGVVEINPIVRVYKSAGRIASFPAYPMGHVDNQVLVLCLFDGEPTPEADPTTGSIFYVEATDEGWVVGDRWYRFDENSQDKLGKRECCQVYTGSLPAAI